MGASAVADGRLPGLVAGTTSGGSEAPQEGPGEARSAAQENGKWKAPTCRRIRSRLTYPGSIARDDSPSLLDGISSRSLLSSETSTAVHPAGKQPGWVHRPVSLAGAARRLSQPCS